MVWSLVESTKAPEYNGDRTLYRSSSILYSTSVPVRLPRLLFIVSHPPSTVLVHGMSFLGRDSGVRGQGSLRRILRNILNEILFCSDKPQRYPEGGRTGSYVGASHSLSCEVGGFQQDTRQINEALALWAEVVGPVLVGFIPKRKRQIHYSTNSRARRERLCAIKGCRK